MSSGTDLAQLVGRRPDDRLLGEDIGKLPAAIGRPEEIPPSPARKRIVAIGATLTGVTLVLGTLLVVFGAVDGVVSGFDVWSVLALAAGIVLVATHWGWVHVAELSGQALERREHRDALDRRQAWLEQIEPYPRWEVGASTGDDGSIAIVTVGYRPVPCREGSFTFVREEVAREVHPGDEPAAVVTERAELLRRRAAEDTARERELYEAAHDAYEQAVLANADEQERLAAVRAASEALSERINANLREPPLVE
jgi:hypothetical protein